MAHRPTDYLSSFAKGLRVVECFSEDSPQMTISEVSKATGLDRATSRRCLLTLHVEGYASYDNKYFTLTPKILRLGMSALTALPLPKIVQPWLDQLSDQIGQSCSVAFLDDTDVVYIARAAQHRVMSIGLMPGSRLPAHCTSMGRVLLAALSEQKMRGILEESNLAPRTLFSISDIDKIQKRIEEVRQDGFALVDQEVELGLRSIAVPLLDRRGRNVAALNIGLAATQTSTEYIKTNYLPLLLNIQNTLQRIL